MSEFKYACPYCGQHIRCDSSQSGSVMQCPTCLQKITAPQAPATADQKFILSGKKIDDRPKVALPAGATAAAPPPTRHFPVAAVALVLLLAGSVTAAVMFRDKLFNPGAGQPPPSVASSPAHPAPPPAPVVAAPPAKDADWRLDLAGAAFPENPAAGRIHGQDFLAERAYWQNGALTLRAGAKGPMDFGFVINFDGAQAEALAGKTINVTSNAPLAARVTLRWKDAGDAVKNNFDTGYALRLEFGALAGNRLPGKIYFCAPDDTRSYIAGAFTAEVRKPKPPKPQP